MMVADTTARRRIPPESEKQFQAAVVKLARILGWRVYHAFDSRRSAPGVPDLLMLRPPRFVVSELKRVGREPTAIQQAWLHDFKLCGIEAYWWTPDCWGEIKRVLGASTIEASNAQGAATLATSGSAASRGLEP